MYTPDASTSRIVWGKKPEPVRETRLGFINVPVYQMQHWDVVKTIAQLDDLIAQPHVGGEFKANLIVARDALKKALPGF